MAAVTIKQLLEAGVHFGHQTRRWNPKMRPYIFGERNGIHIIDLRQTLVQIELAADYLRDLAAGGGTVLFVGTKKQAQGPVAEAAQRAGMPYVNFRWLGGMLTNFTTIQKRIFYMKELERMESSGEINALSKRERLSIRRELDKLQQTLGGVREMARVPEAIFIVDVNTEHTAVKEATRLGITTLALVDSNCDPDHIDFVIAGNDDAIRAASTVAGALAEAAREGRELAGKKSPRPKDEGKEMQARPEAPASQEPAAAVGQESADQQIAPAVEEPASDTPVAAAPVVEGANPPRRRRPMAEVTAKDVQRLRQMAGVGMMDAKKALVEAKGDFDKAMDALRIKGLAKVAKRAGERDANEGTIGTYIHFQADRPVTGVLVELASETDFVAKNPDFRQVADDIAMHVAWGKPRWIRRNDVDPATLEKEKEIIALQAKEEGKPDNIIPKIVEGRVKSFYEDNVLYDQKFVNTEKFEGTVEDLVNSLAARMGENISVRRIARLAIGEQD